jgi:flagellar hook assembly protein FlgD
VLAARSRATLEVFDVEGRRVTTLLDEIIDAGAHTATWNGRDANGRSQPSGVYFCRLMVGSEAADARRIILLK